MEKLGINLSSLVIYTILFFLIFVIAEKTLLPGLRKNIQARKDLIKKNLEQEKELEVELDNMKNNFSKSEMEKLAAIEKMRQEVIDNANEEAKRIVEKAKARAKIIIEDAEIIKNEE